MSDPAPPRVSRAPSLPLVWIIPLIALAVGGWMVFREYRQRGPEITLEFSEGNGIEPRKTIVEYQGVAVGVVTGVALTDDLRRVRVNVRLTKNAAALAREGSQFWVIRPEIGLSGIRGLETLFTGVRITVRPGKGPPATAFAALDKPPPLENTDEGRAFTLVADRLGSLSPGAPVFYREVKVGAVETSRLSEDATSVFIRIRINRPYIDLVRTNTRFWNSGGASFRVSLFGAELKSTSLESLFTGGVAFATPDSGRALAPVAEEGTGFILHAEMDKDWLKWRPVIPIQPPNEAPEPPARSGPLAPLVKQ